MTEHAELDRQANAIARSMMGEFAWPTVVFAVAISVAYVATLGAVVGGELHLGIAYLIVSLLTYAIYTVKHDAVHGSIQGKNKSLAWINSAMGYLAGQILSIPYTIHKLEHLSHHRYTNQKGNDPDLFVDGDSLFDLIKGSFRAVVAQYKYFFTRGWSYASKREKITALIELVSLLSWRIAFVAAGFGVEALVLFVGSTLTGLLILVTFFVWLVHRPFETVERYRNTATYLLPKSVRTVGTWLWLYQNYHSVHHLFPRVPFYRYRQLFEQIEPIMRKHNAPIVEL